MSGSGAEFGVVEWFYPGEYERVEESLKRMRAVGAHRLRTHLSWAEFHAESGREWYDWLIPKLSAEVDLLPSIHYTPPSISETGRSSGPPRDLGALAQFVDEIIGRYPGLHTLELWNEPNNLLDWDWRVDPDWLKFCTMMGRAAHWARERGRRVVLGGPCPNDMNWLRLMGERGVLGVIDVMGVHGFPGTWDSEEGVWTGWPGLIETVRDTMRPFNDEAEIWITEAGYATWRCDAANQAQRFLDALKAPADRLYWYSLQDLQPHVAVQEGHRFDERHYHMGLYDPGGSPKLLARLLADGGPENVREVLELSRPAPAVTGIRPILVTGGAGFIGSNIVDRLCAEGHHVCVYDALARSGVEQNLAWLKERHGHKVSVALGDVRDADALGEAARDADAVFHMASQVAVTSSLENPLWDFEVNLRGTFNVLEALRRSGRNTPLIFASTNKVYGDLADIPLALVDGRWLPEDPALRARGIGEDRPLAFRTPYGCSKGGADQYVLDYAHSFGIPACVMRMSCIYGPRQFGTEDQGWLAHFLIKALKGQKITIFGDGRQVRDVMWVEDTVEAYLAALRNIGGVSGQVFNLGGGAKNAVSLRQVLAFIETLTGRPLDIEFQDWRAGDQRYFVADLGLARETFGLAEPLDWQTGLRRLTGWLQANRDDLEVTPASVRTAGAQ
ncbi:SDR family NAD(P)-dependent oxidoreductase [Lutibaculum baratangense]|uniref:Nucleoside-diphosphate-sugar epimerase n=1 Tax=Lutibaculum baratangense AMV1 TaxID=631454 RepID=V4RQ44_9HYPH|nr:SDR family NAD(P)-dependent oxidoreductase [Lutibaculum baratangense]ESR25305.1 Nucleoside-diphosphate-sugar epimerase [Lutibaculum baratangense AMV1]